MRLSTTGSDLSILHQGDCQLVAQGCSGGAGCSCHSSWGLYVELLLAEGKPLLEEVGTPDMEGIGGMLKLSPCWEQRGDVFPWIKTTNSDYFQAEG